MRIGVLGMNFKSAGIDMREMVSKACHEQLSCMSSLAEKYACVVLSTCNRIEIFFSADDLADAHSDLLRILRDAISMPFEHNMYSYFGLDCFLHLAQVTSGLDSAIVAESEIQRQVKVAYEKTLYYYSLPSCMHFLFQKSLKLGKEIRSRLSFSQNQVTIAKILFEISGQLLKDVHSTPLLFIGNSEINRRSIAYFKRKGMQKMALCTRSLHAAQAVAEKEGLSLLPWDKLSSWKEYPLVICGSNAPHFIVSGKTEECKTRLIFDLSVPRNVDPSLAYHPQLTLLNMQQLTEITDARQRKNAIEILNAKEILITGVQRYVHSFHQKENRIFVCA